jgi:purple acid phosphatase-like protein/calcineurin-like phosphoesterase family protein/pectate lyase-like protein/fibronectin type III domain protein
MKTATFGSSSPRRWGILFTALLIAGYALGLSLDAAALAITRGPYLQLGTQSSIVVRWRTDAATDSRVRYGTSPTDLRSVVDDAATTTEHVVKLTDLNPATQYYYSIGNSTATLAGGDGSHFFVTAPTPGTEQPAHIWVVGDLGTTKSKTQTVRDAYLNYKGSRNTDLWLMLGDSAYIDGTNSEYQAALFNMYPTLLRQTVLWPTLGDRDGHMADSASQSGPYYDIFTLPKQGEAGGVASGTEAYYSFDYANIHFVVLDSVETSRAPTRAMLTWLKNDLAATTQPWIIAYWHHSPYSKGLHDFNSEIRLREMHQNVLPILEEAGVDLVLSGHSASYERSFLIDGHYGTSSTFDSATMLVDGGDGRIDGNGAYQKSTVELAPGTVYAVVGGPSENRLGSLDHPVMYVSLKVLGSMLLDVDGPVLDATFLDDTGQIWDRFRMVKTTSTAKTKISDADGETPSPSEMTAPAVSALVAANTSAQSTSVPPTARAAATPAYYVDTNHPSASDSNPGTEALPWKTIQKAANTLVAGDTVYIKQGTYTGLVSPKNSGSASAWITYSAYLGHEHKAILDGSAFEIRGKNYIKVSGLRIQNVTGAIGVDRGIYVLGPSSNITLSGNHTYNTKSSGISIWGVPWGDDPNVYGYKAITNLIIENNKVENCVTPGGYDECITLANGVDTFEIRGNHIFNGNDGCCGGEGIDVKNGVSNGKIYRNEIYNFHKIAIYLDAGGSGGSYAAGWLRNIDIFENYVRDTSKGTGISVVSEGPGNIDGIKVYNNLVTNSGGDGILLYKHPWEQGTAVIKNVTFINNTTYNNGLMPVHGGGGVRINHPTAQNVIVRNNIAYKNQDFQILADPAAPGTLVDHNLTTDPHFVNEAAKDFRLKSTSPAINAGSSTLASATDYDGVPRPQGSAFDIGAYEFGESVPPSDTTPPSTHTALSATAISSSQVNLSWTASTDNIGVTGYRVERCQGAGCTNFAQIATPPGTTYSNTGLSANTTYTVSD